MGLESVFYQIIEILLSVESTVESRAMRSIGRDLGSAQTKQEYDVAVKKRAELEEMASQARRVKTTFEKEKVLRDSNSTRKEKEFARRKAKELRDNEPEYKQRMRHIIDNYEAREKRKRGI